MESINQLYQQLTNHPISFEMFMQHALYNPHFGYYTTKQHIFGSQGDFVTAPEISSLFAKTLAKQLLEYVAIDPKYSILEFGGGTGKLALDLLLSLADDNALPTNYYIVELSPKLQQLQRQTIADICPDLLAITKWITKLPENNFHGIVIANEVLDAMPVNIYHLAETISEYYVACQAGQLQLQKVPVSDPTVLACLQQIQQQYLTDVTEHNLAINNYLTNWLQELNRILIKGIICLFDYGFSANDYFHPSRSQHAITCHYQHQLHHDPLVNIGQQDITAHVNFSEVAKLASALSLQVSGYTTQANFLLQGGILDVLPEATGAQAVALATQLKRLTFPSEQGEIFKILCLNKNIDVVLSGLMPSFLRVL